MDPAVLLTLRFSFALLLAAAATHKLRDLARFREVLASYELLPERAARTVAPAIAALEAVLATAIVAGVELPAAGAAVSALMFAYAAAIQVNVARGRTDIDCGCMGPAARVPLSPALVVRNLLLAAAATLLVVPSSVRVAGWIDLATALAATLVLSACWLASERMLALAPRAARLRAAASRTPRAEAPR